MFILDSHDKLFWSTLRCHPIWLYHVDGAEDVPSEARLPT